MSDASIIALITVIRGFLLCFGLVFSIGLIDDIRHGWDLDVKSFLRPSILLSLFWILGEILR